MGRRFENGRAYATTHCWEERDLARTWREAWPRVLDLLDKYAAGDDSAGKYLVTHLYGSPHSVPLPQLFPEFGHIRNRVSNHDSAVWGILVNGIIFPCYNEAIEDRIITLSEVVKDEAAAERLLSFWHRLTDVAIFIKETAPDLDIGGVVLRTFEEYFRTDAIEMMIQLAALYYPPVATLKKVWEKYQRSKKAGRPTDAATIFRDVRDAAEGIDDIINGGNQFVGDVTDSIKESVANILEEVTAWIEELVKTITDAISGLVADIVDAVSDAFRNIAATLQALIDGATDYIRDLADAVLVAVESLIDDAVSTMQSAFDSAVEYVSDLVQQVAEWFQGIADTLSQEITEVFDGIETFITEIGAQLSSLLDPIIGEAQSIASSAIELVESVPQALGDIADRAIEFAETLPERYGEAFKAAMLNPLLTILISEDTSDPDEDEKTVAMVVAASGIDEETAADIARQIASVAPRSVLPRKLFLGVAMLFLLWQSLSAPISVAAERAKQAASIALPHRIMQDADLLVAMVRGLKPEDEAIRELRSSGYSEEDARRMLAMRRQLVPAGELLTWWLRGLIDDAQLQEQFNLQALSSDDQERLKQAAFFIPQPQDLITMAVREVFSRETAERFGQFEDFPEEFAKYARMQGISEEWARNYWAAHWGLPSPQMGFEMLHRRIIDENDLKLLLKALDVMPYWRDKLIQLSYSPITRVDIRRMHKVGVLDEAQVRSAYLDIGYSPQNAERLTQFVLLLNKPKRAENADELLDLSKGQILLSYREGILSRERARVLLIGLGLSDEASDVLIELADLDRERDERKQEIALVQEQFKSGLLSFDEASALIASLGLATIEQSRAIEQLARLEKARTKMPSKADLDKFWLEDIIDDAEYLRNLELLGYPAIWAERYLTLLDKRGSKDA